MPQTTRCSHFSKTLGYRGVIVCGAVNLVSTFCARVTLMYDVIKSAFIETLVQTNLFWRIANISCSTITNRPSTTVCGTTFDERYGHSD